MLPLGHHLMVHKTVFWCPFEKWFSIGCDAILKSWNIFMIQTVGVLLGDSTFLIRVYIKC